MKAFRHSIPETINAVIADELLNNVFDDDFGGSDYGYNAMAKAKGETSFAQYMDYQYRMHQPGNHQDYVCFSDCPYVSGVVY